MHPKCVLIIISLFSVLSEKLPLLQKNINIKEVTNIYTHTFQSLLNKLNAKINSLSCTIKSLPEGKLICIRNGKYLKWYHSDGHNITYIPKKNRKLAELLAQKKYYSLQLQETILEKESIELYLKHKDSLKHSSIDLFLPDSKYSELLSPHFSSHAEKIKNWLSEPYESNPAHIEALQHPTIAGINVRSKSEAMIVYVLHSHNIPFKYEYPLRLGTTTYYPDFTIMHPKTEKIIYYEHFGLMDDSNYSRKCAQKLYRYITNSIIPDINLITTYETDEHPLNFLIIEEKLRFMGLID